MAGLLLMAALLSVAIGQQQVGVSLVLLGQTIPNNSLVNLGDLAYQSPNLPGFTEEPTNANGRQTLMCVTDLIACCETEGLGNWHLPANIEGGGVFRINRDQNEERNGQQFYGSVRLWQRYTPRERGLFRCELPDANGVNQNLYVNILFFAPTNGTSLIITSSGSNTAGETYSLMCSATLHSNNPPSPESYIMPPPTYEWFFGPNGNDPLPSGLTPTATTLGTDNIYRSTLQFSPLSQSLHTGNYTCRLGAGSLVNSNTFTVTPPSISAAIISNLNERLVVGQTDNTLTCGVTGAGNLNPTIAYQWTKNNGGAQTQVGSSRILTLPSLTLSSAGEYSCRATVGSALLTRNIEASADTPQRVEIQIPDPQSVTVTSSPDTIVLCVSTVTVTCTVELGPAVMESELSLLMVSAQVSRNGTPLSLTEPTVTGTTFNFGTTVTSFSENDVGNYTCHATIRPQPSTFLIGMGQLESSPFEVTIGIPLPGSSGNTKCYSANDIAIAVVATILIECVLAVPIIAAVSALCWKRIQRRPQYKRDNTTTDSIQGGEVNPGEDVYEEPDIKTAATTAPGKFKLTECPAYMATTNALQPCAVSEAQSKLQSGYYEL